MLSEQEIEFGECCRVLWAKQTSKPITQREIEYGRLVIAAYQAKLLAGVEMPEPFDTQYDEIDKEEFGIYAEAHLKQYAAAAAAQARVKALDEAIRIAAITANLCLHPSEIAAAIEQLKVKP